MIDLDNILNDLKKSFPDIRINSDISLPTVYANFDATYRCFKLLIQTIKMFKQTSTITFTWKVVDGANELHISNNAFSIFFDIPNALYDQEAATQYQTILEIKTLITLNKWDLELKEHPDFVFIIKNIKIK